MNFAYGQEEVVGTAWYIYAIWGALGLGGIVALIASFFTVGEQECYVIERFGKFLRIARPGLHFKIPFVDQIYDEVDLRVQELKIEVETKTEDNVFVNLEISLQYCVRLDKVYEASYKTQDIRTQIRSYVFDVVRAQVPTMTLDKLFDNKDEIAAAVKVELSPVMQELGHDIIKALVTDVDPDENVKDAMNEINTQQRLRVAATEKGEAERILLVKRAEAEAESKKLQGQGIADQRKAIVAGLQESVELFRKSIPGATPQDAMQLVLATQYFDMLKEVGQHSKTTTIMLPHAPGGLSDIMGQMQTLLASNTTTSTTSAPEA